MKIKTTDLAGIALNWAVAVCEGGENLWFDTVCGWWITINGKDRALSGGWSASQSFQPSSDWALGGSIIEREKIGVSFQCGVWYAYPQPPQSGFMDEVTGAPGPTPLIAAMRCYVASKLGDEVEVPDELCA